MKNWLKRFLHRDDPDEAAVAQAAEPKRADKTDAEPKGSYLTDAPIASKTQDTFNRWPFAKRIANTLAAREDSSSLVIGLYGAWGDGKTSTLNMMAAALGGHENIVVVRFNPWLFRSEEQLLRGFFVTLAEALEKSLPTMAQKLGGALRKYGSMLSAIPTGPIGGLDVGEAAKGLGAALAEVKLDDERERVEKFLDESGKGVVVLIDDIDRLDRLETHAMLKLVKLSASFKHTSYILAFDEDMVAAAIGERYGEGGAEAGRHFLEKIIQVPLHLPPPDAMALRRLTFEGVERALAVSEIPFSQEQADAFTQQFIAGLEPQLTTPRHAKLYTNAVLFALPLLKGEANPVDVLLIEAIRTFYPNLYKAIRDNADFFLHSDIVAGERNDARRQRINELIDGALLHVEVNDKGAVRRELLESMFPRLRNVGYDADWDKEWEEGQRICSSHYFNRYFTYSVPPGDISDLEVGDLLEALERPEAREPDAALAQFAARNALPQLIRKLRRREDGISAAASRQLIMAVGRNGPLMPRERRTFLGEATYVQAGILVAHLLRSIPLGEEREQLAAELIRTAEPISFSWECFSWIRHNEDRPEDRRVISDEAEARIAPILAQRIAESAKAGPLYATFGRDAPRLYWFWAKYGDADAVRAHLSDRFAMHPEEVDVFIDPFVGEGREIETGVHLRTDFDRGSYASVAQVIDPAIIFANLRQRYGTELDNAQFYQGRDVPIPTRFARQFAFVHRSVQSETAPSQAPATAPRETSQE